MPRREKPDNDPAPKKRPRKRAAKAKSQTVQHKKQQQFLDHYRRMRNIGRACEAAIIGRQTHYNWLASDPDYAQRFKEATDDHSRKLKRRNDFTRPPSVRSLSEAFGVDAVARDPCSQPWCMRSLTLYGVAGVVRCG